MRNTILNAFFAMAAIFSLFSCTKQDESRGGVSFEIGSDCEIQEVSKGKISDYITLPAAADFTITITKTATSEVFWTGKLSEWSDKTPMNAGDYNVVAEYGSSTEEGFEKPWFKGSVNFAVNGASTTKVTVPVKLQNCMVKVSRTDAFNKYFTGSSVTVKTDQGLEIVFGKDEKRAAFVEAYKIIVSASLINQGQAAVPFEPVTYADLEAATCYSLVFDASKTGGSTISISFNDSVVTVPVGDIELN